MQHLIVTKLSQLAQLAYIQGNVNLDAPPEGLQMLATCVVGGVPVMVIKSEKAWLLILRPRAEEGQVALGHLYRKQTDGEWDDLNLIISPDLSCTDLAGRTVENLPILQGPATYISDWIQRGV